MPKGTQVSETTVNAQAQMHEAKRDEIGDRLNNVLHTINEVKASSRSGLTMALAEAGERWTTAVRKSVLAHMTAMAENIRRAASDQNQADEENVKSVNNLPIATMSFLGK